MPLLLLALVLLLSLTVSSAVRAQDVATVGDARIQTMKEGVEAGGDCGCYFYSPDRPLVEDTLIIYWAFGERAVMRVNDELISLEKSLDKGEVQLPDRLGDESQFTLAASDLVVRGTIKVIDVCDEDNESCESTSYRGNASLMSKGKQVIVPIWGMCGC